MSVYMDNAATTPLDEDVFEAMKPYFFEHFGNPSSIHAHGRHTKSAVEEARKTIAEGINASAAEIFFTSGGTESDNMVLRSAVNSLGVKHIVTSPLEHHAVLHTAGALQQEKGIEVHYVDVDDRGVLNLKHLEQTLKGLSEKALVSIMHANNELGNLNDLEAIGDLCRAYKAYFHSDTVQTIAHYPFDVQRLPVDFLVGSAHKFHGPKGVGFVYINNDVQLKPLLYGGAQERNMRGGTENTAGIVGLAKAFEQAQQNLEQDRQHIESLKTHMIKSLQAQLPDVAFNGLSGDMDKSLYSILNISLPEADFNDMLVFTLDINGISASGGSACASGSDIGSHVLDHLKVPPMRGHIRFSFSKYNTKEDVDYVVAKLKEMYVPG